jgi:hypothetical protein
VPIEPGAEPSKEMDARSWARWCRKQKPGPRVVDDYVDDAAAAIAGIPIGGLYHASGVVRVRRT